MPIACKFPVTPLSQNEFHAVDKTVMKHAFDIQNKLGRLCDEQIYQNELAYRCQQDGLEVLTEAMINVTHRTFCKTYYLDMLAMHGGIYELKTVGALHPNHSNQLINYLLLSALHHGKLINFRPPSVEHRFISTKLTPELRRQAVVDKTDWDESDEPSQLVSQTVHSLINDWGAFLDIDLYKEALLHFLPEQSLQPIEIVLNGRTIGHQNICLLQPDTGLHISSIKEGAVAYSTHVRHLFNHTRLKRVQWINFNQSTIQMVTLKK
jgi:GxxExxY protein